MQGLVEFDNLSVDAPIFLPDGTGPGAAGRAQIIWSTETGYTPVGPIQGFLASAPEAAFYLISDVVPVPWPARPHDCNIAGAGLG